MVLIYAIGKGMMRMSAMRILHGYLLVQKTGRIGNAKILFSTVQARNSRARAGLIRNSNAAFEIRKSREWL
jgi:hypothetical protein